MERPRSSSGAFAAALAVAAEQGLPTAEPCVVRDVTNLIVHLAPAPVVARVPLTLSLLRGRDWYAREVDLAGALVARGAAVAPPAPGLDPGPHERDGFLVSLWDVDHDPERFDPVLAGRSLAELHAALARCGGMLPRFDRLDELGLLLERLEPTAAASADDIRALREVGARLAARPLPPGARPLHGDSHFGNILWTGDGPLWTDLENVCSGPVEFDLACLAWRDAPGTAAALEAYGPHDPAIVRAVTPYLVLLLAAWTLVVAARVPTEAAVAEARRRVAYAREM